MEWPLVGARFALLVLALGTAFDTLCVLAEGRQIHRYQDIVVPAVLLALFALSMGWLS